MIQRSIASQFASARVMIRNAKNHPVIQQKLAEWGYSQQHMLQGTVALEELEAVQQEQEECYNTKSNIDRNWRTQLASLRKSYAEHRAVAKIVFRHQPELLQRLRLHQPMPRRQPDWVMQTRAFYRVIVSESKEMQKLGIKAEDLTQTQATVNALLNLQEQRLQCKGDAESATQKRNEVRAKLRAWQQEFIRMAKMALKDDPQLLEVLGIVVT